MWGGAGSVYGGSGMDEDWDSVTDSGRVSEREGAGMGRGRGLREGREMGFA